MKKQIIKTLLPITSVALAATPLITLTCCNKGVLFHNLKTTFDWQKWSDYSEGHFYFRFEKVYDERLTTLIIDIDYDKIEYPQKSYDITHKFDSNTLKCIFDTKNYFGVYFEINEFYPIVQNLSDGDVISIPVLVKCVNIEKTDEVLWTQEAKLQLVHKFEQPK